MTATERELQEVLANFVKIISDNQKFLQEELAKAEENVLILKGRSFQNQTLLESFIESEKKREAAKNAPPTEPSDLDKEVEKRKKKGLCIFKERRGDWCNKQATKKTGYCRSCNRKLGLLNGKK